MFKRERFVALTLFSRPDGIPSSEILLWDRSSSRLSFIVGFVADRHFVPIGWAYVHPIGWHPHAGPNKCHWGQQMREQSDIHALWRDGKPGPFPPMGQSPHLGWNTPVQLTTLYSVRARNDAGAAREALRHLKEGRAPLEWIDMSNEKHWTITIEQQHKAQRPT